jgi:hypothetical protein
MMHGILNFLKMIQDDSTQSPGIEIGFFLKYKTSLKSSILKGSKIFKDAELDPEYLLGIPSFQVFLTPHRNPLLVSSLISE